jgi:hypothetical protein
LNKRLIKLVEKWRAGGSPQQEGFDWTSSKKNWNEAFPEHSKFINTLPGEIDRGAVRKICSADSYSIGQKFLAVMVWGYGDRGYGPYRVTQMLNQENALIVLNQVYELAQGGDVKSAYDFLDKLLQFCSNSDTALAMAMHYKQRSNENNESAVVLRYNEINQILRSC